MDQSLSLVPEPQIWRIRPAVRLAWVILAAGWLAMTIGIAVMGASSIHIAIQCLICVALAVACWRMAFAPYVELGADALVVQNRIHRVCIPYAAIESVEMSHNGLAIARHDTPEPVVAWAIQKSNLGKGGGHAASPADQAIEAIEKRVPLEAMAA